METINLRENKKFGKYYAFVLEAIDKRCINEDVNLVTDKDKIDLVFYSLYNEFIDLEDYDHEVDALAAYLREDPYFIWLPITIGYIAEVGKEWGYCRNEKEYNKFVRHFHYLIAGLLVRAKNKYYPKGNTKWDKELFWKYDYSYYYKAYTSLGGLYCKITRKEDKYILAYGENEKEFNSLNEAKEYAQKIFEQFLEEKVNSDE